jgi:hypothetical protein
MLQAKSNWFKLVFLRLPVRVCSDSAIGKPGISLQVKRRCQSWQKCRLFFKFKIFVWQIKFYIQYNNNNNNNPLVCPCFCAKNLP